ncbi:RNA-directed DNA polymerase, eukaryota, reverse transcriptase zinc-binding domain protein [Tanacetum coccineum]
MRYRAGKEDGCEGFDGNLTGIQFPPMNGMVENKDEDIEGKKGCLGNGSNSKNHSAKSDDCVEVVNEGDDSSNNEFGTKFNDKDEEVVKKANVSSQNSGSKETNSSTGKSLADIVKSNRLDNKLIVPTEVSENRDSVVDEEGIIENVPMKACNVKGISALTSSIGKYVIMDEITTRMCVTRVGRIRFARVLVEIDAEKGIKEIEIMYKSKSITEGTKKIVDNGQFNRMRNERRNVRGNNQWQTNNKFEYRRRKEDEGKCKGLDDNKGIDVEDDGLKTSNKQASRGSRNIKDTKKENQKGSTSVDNSNRNGISKSNKFTLRNSLINEEDLIPNNDQRMIVDEFLRSKDCEGVVGYGKVIDVFIPNRRSKAGKRFAFVRFIRVNDLDRLVGNLCTIWIGRFHLHANVARFERANKPVKPSGPSQSNAHGVNSWFCTLLNAYNDFVSENVLFGWTLKVSPPSCLSRKRFKELEINGSEALDIEDNFGSSFARKCLGLGRRNFYLESEFSLNLRVCYTSIDESKHGARILMMGQKRVDAKVQEEMQDLSLIIRLWFKIKVVLLYKRKNSLQMIDPLLIKTWKGENVSDDILLHRMNLKPTGFKILNFLRLRIRRDLRITLKFDIQNRAANRIRCAVLNTPFRYLGVTDEECMSPEVGLGLALVNKLPSPGSKGVLKTLWNLSVWDDLSSSIPKLGCPLVFQRLGGLCDLSGDWRVQGMNGWTEEMKRYYRDRKELFNAAKEIEGNKDVMEEDCDEGKGIRVYKFNLEYAAGIKLVVELPFNARLLSSTSQAVLELLLRSSSVSAQPHKLK